MAAQKHSAAKRAGPTKRHGAEKSSQVVAGKGQLNLKTWQSLEP